MASDLSILNILLASAMLLFTSYLDLRKREVEDKVWIGFAAAAVLLQFYEILTGESLLFPLLISIGLASAIGMGLFFLGFYGGADGKALIVLAVFVPILHPGIGLYDIAPLIVLTNGVLLSILLPIAILIFNISRVIRKKEIFSGFDEPLYRKVLACFLGYKQMGRARAFQFSMERKGSDQTERKFDFSMMRDDFETETGTWVTPGIPLLVFLTAGFFVLMLYGDLVIWIIEGLAKLAL